MYREGGVEAMFEIKKSPGGVRVIPGWAEAALAKRLQEPEHGFASYYAVQSAVSREPGGRGGVSWGVSDDSLSTSSPS